MSLLKSEQRARVVLVVVGLPSLCQIVGGSRRQQNTFRVRLVIADRRLELLYVLVAVLRFGGHRLHRDLDQLTLLVSRCDFIPRRRHQALHGVLGEMRRVAGEELVQDRAEQIDVAGRTDLADRAGRHFRSHVRGRTTHRLGVGNAA